MAEEGEQGLPRELAVDGEAAAEASESSLWSEWVLLQGGRQSRDQELFTQRPPQRLHQPCRAPSPSPRNEGDVGYCPVPLAPGTGGIYLPRM